MLDHALQQPTPPQRLVVIGGHGFIGGAIVRRARADDINVVALGREDVDLLASDASTVLARHLKDGDCVIAASAIAPCKNVDMLVDNLVLARAILAALAVVRPSQVINISSDAVYGDAPLPLHEGVAPSPGSLHGAMHLARELAFQASIDAPLAILRPTLVYGAADPHNGYGPNRFRRLAAAGEEIVLFGEGEERRDHVLVDDVAELALRIALHRSTGVLNVATGAVHTFRAIAEQLAARAGRNSTVRGTLRVGAMPHGGYRPFDASATSAAFPDFRYVPLAEGLQRIEQEIAANG